MKTVSLSQFKSEHARDLAGWLIADHVAPWFPHPEEYIEWAVNLPDNGRQYVVSVDGHPSGYIRWTYVPREVLDEVGFQDIPSDSADIDLLLGEKSMTGRGIAGEIFRLALAKIQSEGIATLAALTTSVDNMNAHKAFERAGFVIDRVYEPEGFGKCYLMLRSI